MQTHVMQRLPQMATWGWFQNCCHGPVISNITVETRMFTEQKVTKSNLSINSPFKTTVHDLDNFNELKLKIMHN